METPNTPIEPEGVKLPKWLVTLSLGLLASAIFTLLGRKIGLFGFLIFLPFLFGRIGKRK
ncbi:MAG: hypothetical protein OEM52_02765 [bacterium]|nr:hypothetical protein [bacterium]